MVCNGKTKSVFRVFSAVSVFRGVPDCSGVFRGVPVFLVLVHPGYPRDGLTTRDRLAAKDLLA